MISAISSCDQILPYRQRTTLDSLIKVHAILMRLNRVTDII